MEEHIRILEVNDGEKKSAYTREVLYKLPQWFGNKQSLEEYAEEVKEYPFYSAVDDTGKCVGFFSVKIHYQHTGDIFVCGVLPEYQHTGIGKALYRTSEEYFIKSGCKYVIVKTLSDIVDSEPYERTRRFYRSIGFDTLLTLTEMWDEKNPCLIMFKDIRLSKMNCRKEQLLLYAVTDRSWLKGETLYEQIEKALKGGVTFLQLREKTLSEEEFLKEAAEVKKLCQLYHVPFIINDNVEIALKSGADGVHIGQGDMGVKEARKILGPDKIIGVSARTVEQARKAQEEGADYLGSGAVFQTGTKGDAKPLDHKVLKEICASVEIPVVAIGGITRENIRQLKGCGMDGAAVVSAVFAQRDIEGAAMELREILEDMITSGE
jgi:thiamine-phosphate pyrophosphorylase